MNPRARNGILHIQSLSFAYSGQPALFCDWSAAIGAGVTAVIEWSRVPMLAGVPQLAADGFITGASGRNWDGYGAQVALADGLPATARDLLSDPQTSGGLLVSCAPDTVAEVLRVFREQGFAQAAVIGRIEAGAAGLRVDT